MLVTYLPFLVFALKRSDVFSLFSGVLRRRAREKKKKRKIFEVGEVLFWVGSTGWFSVFLSTLTPKVQSNVHDMFNLVR